MAHSGRVTKLRAITVGSGFPTWGGKQGGGFTVFRANVGGKAIQFEAVRRQNGNVTQIRNDNKADSRAEIRWKDLSEKVKKRIKRKIENCNYKNENPSVFTDQYCD